MDLTPRDMTLQTIAVLLVRRVLTGVMTKSEIEDNTRLMMQVALGVMLLLT